MNSSIPRLSCFLAFSCALVLGVACSPQPASDAGVSAAPAVVFRDTTAQGGYVVEVRSRPNPIPLNEPFELDVTLFDASDEMPADDVVVTVDGTMPGHGHGMLRKSVTEAQGEGAYLTKGMLFHMGGYWELSVDVARRVEAGDHFTVSTESVIFPVEL